jgi:hypothetical protein
MIKVSAGIVVFLVGISEDTVLCKTSPSLAVLGPHLPEL